MENSRWPPCSPVTAPAKFPAKRFHLPSLVQSNPARGQGHVCKFSPRNTLLWAGRGGGIVNFADIPKGVCLCRDHKQGSLFQTSIITSPVRWSPEQHAIILTLKGCLLSNREGNTPQVGGDEEGKWLYITTPIPCASKAPPVLDVSVGWKVTQELVRNAAPTMHPHI